MILIRQVRLVEVYKICECMPEQFDDVLGLSRMVVENEKGPISQVSKPENSAEWAKNNSLKI